MNYLTSFDVFSKVILNLYVLVHVLARILDKIPGAGAVPKQAGSETMSTTLVSRFCFTEPGGVLLASLLIVSFTFNLLLIHLPADLITAIFSLIVRIYK